MTFWLVCLLCMRLSNAVINVQAPIYILNTSLPVSEYYAPVCKDKKQDALTAFSVMLDMIPTALQPAFEDIAMTFWRNDITEPYKSEIEYFSECSGLTIKDLITVNLVYDLIAMCTSIVAADSNGKVYHARNFDFPVVLRNDTVNLIFVDADNNTLYEMATPAGVYVCVCVCICIHFVHKYTTYLYMLYHKIYAKVMLECLLEINQMHFPLRWMKDIW